MPLEEMEKAKEKGKEAKEAKAITPDSPGTIKANNQAIKAARAACTETRGAKVVQHVLIVVKMGIYRPIAPSPKCATIAGAHFIWATPAPSGQAREVEQARVRARAKPGSTVFNKGSLKNPNISNKMKNRTKRARSVSTRCA